MTKIGKIMKHVGQRVIKFVFLLYRLLGLNYILCMWREHFSPQQETSKSFTIMNYMLYFVAIVANVVLCNRYSLVFLYLGIAVEVCTISFLDFV